jgi:hypothetical protein
MDRRLHGRPSWKATLLASLGLAGACLASGCTGGDLRLWRVCEITLEAKMPHPQPTQVHLSATFQGPDSETIQVRGFWDGGDTWRLRFAPTHQGRWTWATICSETDDPGLHGVTGQLRVGPPQGDNPLYQHGGFLRVSQNRRHLTYTDGTPFFWLGDTWWFCPSALVPIQGSSHPGYDSMFRTLVGKRSAQGYTVAQWAFQGEPVLHNALMLPLAAQGRINPAYWQQVDAYVTYATEAGLLPAIALAFHSSGDQLNLEQWEFLWQYVIARYGAYPVTWIISGEYNADIGDAANRVPKMLALGAYIKANDPYRRAMSIHPWWYQGDKRQAWDEPWYDFIMFQGAHQAFPDIDLYLKAYELPNPKPFLEAECNYEGIHGMTDDDVRWAAYRAIQAGSLGYSYGAHGLWYPTQGFDDNTFDNWGKPIPWWEALELPGGAQMTHLRALYESVPWWELEPRPDALKVRGFSTYIMRPIAKAVGTDLWVIYFGRGLQSDASVSLLEAPSGASYNGHWFDPRTGESSSIPELLVCHGEPVELPARPNVEDWVLVLQREN